MELYVSCLYILCGTDRFNFTFPLFTLCRHISGNWIQIAVILCVYYSSYFQFIPKYIWIAGAVTVLWSEYLQIYSNPSKCKRYVSSPNQPRDLKVYSLSHSLNNAGFFLKVKCLGTTPWHLVLELRMSGFIIHFCISCHCRETSFIAGQSKCDLRWTKWHWDRIFSQYFSLLLSVSCHHCSILIDSMMVSVV